MMMLIKPHDYQGNINSEPPSGSRSTCIWSQSYYYFIIEVPNSFIIGTSHINILILLPEVGAATRLSFYAPVGRARSLRELGGLRPP